jgi:hypothetical protein
LHEKIADHYELNVEKQYTMEPKNRLTQNTVALPNPLDGTTDRTTSHLTRLSKYDNQVIGYSHSTRPANGFA